MTCSSASGRPTSRGDRWALDTECDLAVEARRRTTTAPASVASAIGCSAEHLGLTPEDVERRLERTRSLRALIDSRADAEHTLVRIELPAERETAASEALRAVADPEEPMAFGPAVAELVPPADATNGLRPIPSADRAGDRRCRGHRRDHAGRNLEAGAAGDSADGSRQFPACRRCCGLASRRLSSRIWCWSHWS